MEATDFCYWLQGFFELSEDKKLTPKQVEIIKDHLQLVFNKVTPDRSSSASMPSNSTSSGPICNISTKDENQSINDILSNVDKNKAGGIRGNGVRVYC